MTNEFVYVLVEQKLHDNRGPFFGISKKDTYYGYRGDEGEAKQRLKAYKTHEDTPYIIVPVTYGPGLIREFVPTFIALAISDDKENNQLVEKLFVEQWGAILWPGKDVSEAMKNFIRWNFTQRKQFQRSYNDEAVALTWITPEYPGLKVRFKQFVLLNP